MQTGGVFSPFRAPAPPVDDAAPGRPAVSKTPPLV